MMSERKQVWGARVILLLLASLPFLGLSFIPVHTNVWPYGHVSNVLEIGGGAFLFYGACVIGATGAIIALALGLMALTWSLQVVYRTALRKPHRTFQSWGMSEIDCENQGIPYKTGFGR